MTYPQSPGSVDLTFEFPAGSGTVADLTFGATLGPPPGTVYEAAFDAKFKLRAAVTVNYDTAQWRGLSASTTVRHQQALARGKHTAIPWEPPVRGTLLSAMPHQQAQRAGRITQAMWSVPHRGHRQDALAWDGAGHSTGSTTFTAWRVPVKGSRTDVLPWATGAHRGSAAAVAFGLAKRQHRADAAGWDEARQQQHAVTSRMNQMAKSMKPFVVAPWRKAAVVASYGGPRYLPLAPSVPPGPPVVAIDVSFCALYPATDQTTLVFGLNPCGSVTPDSMLYILPARFFMAVHSLEAQLLPGLASIPIFDVSLSADSGSFAWTFSASGPAQLFDALAPAGGVPAQIRITLDGMPWVFVVDSLQRQHEFGKTGTRIAGRSATAAVGAPYARELPRLNATAQNAQQLAAAALSLTGVDLDWGIADWLVPAGAWSHTGTSLAAVQAIAEAAGGYVNSHRSAPTLLVRHPYPTLPGGISGGPWNWGGAFAADVELAPDAIITSSIERRDGPDLDGIYVSGASQGVLGLVRRTGTTGSKLAAMVTDPLITANAVAQQRGLSVLGAAGAKHLVQISMPILTGGANPGVLDVGQLVQINESVPWRGRVRSVGVQASMPTARQQITLERHL